MQQSYEILAANSNWQAGNTFTKNTVPTWLTDFILGEGSLTKSLLDLSAGNFKVNVLNETITLPYFHEQKNLTTPLYMWAKVRQVELNIHDEAVVFARSIIPLALIQKGQSGLANLGQKPLGHLLFRYGKTDISKREFSCLKFNEEEYYARRTPYKYLDKNILVSEYFLPSLKKYII